MQIIAKGLTIRMKVVSNQTSLVQVIESIEIEGNPSGVLVKVKGSEGSFWYNQYEIVTVLEE
jgi:hypothetical protein